VANNGICKELRDFEEREEGLEEYRKVKKEKW
jgi:hypothetical protein